MMLLQDRARRATRVALVGMACNIFLALAKLAAGLFGRSSALIADAVHSLSDLGTDVVALVGVRISRRPADDGHPYGHGKIETLATVVIGGVLVFVGGDMFLGAARNLLAALEGRLPPQPSMVAAFVAGTSIVIKEVLYRYTRAAARSLESRALEANAWHQRSDALSSVGTTAGVVAASLLGGSWSILDPAAAMVVSVIVVRVGAKILWPATHELLDGAADRSSTEQVVRSILSIPGAANPHDIRIRRVGHATAIEAHLEVYDHLPVEAACKLTGDADRAIRACFGQDTYVTLRLDPYTGER